MNTEKFDDKATYGAVRGAIRAQGIEKVRLAVYGQDNVYKQEHVNEAVALCIYINSRMAKKELQAKLDKMGY